MESTSVRRPMGLLMCLCALIFTAAFILISWPKIEPYLTSLRTPAGNTTIIVTATPGTGVRPTQPPYTPPRTNESNAPALTLDQVNATSIAIYHATAAAAEPNVNNTGDTAPLQRQSITVDRQPAPDYAPTAEPIPQTQVDGAFGSKPAPPVNIQETHQCKHGQVWTDAGCKNPTPVQ